MGKRGLVLDKKGDLTSTQIIILVLAIAGFLIVLFFLFASDMFGEDQREICHVSVITRATAPDFAQKSVPLKCKSEEICLTEDIGKRCVDQFGKDEDVHFVVLKGSDGQKAEKIAETNANAMFDCWSMMGEGKLDLFGSVTNSLFGIATSSCVICSRVAVDKSVNPELLKLVNIENYMKANQVPGQAYTYMNALTSGQIESFTKATDPAGLKYDLSNQAILFMQIKSQNVRESLENLFNTGGLLLLGGSQVPGAGKLISKLFFTKAGLAIFIPAAGLTTAYATISTLNGQKVATSYCGSFTSSAEVSKGCSIVQGMNWNAAEVNSLCSTIEGEI